MCLTTSGLLDSVRCRSCVETTPYRLGQTLAMHYVSSALFKAGWVVGSLELLGSPTALARTVSLGLKDFVRLPYQVPGPLPTQNKNRIPFPYNSILPSPSLFPPF